MKYLSILLLTVFPISAFAEPAADLVCRTVKTSTQTEPALNCILVEPPPCEGLWRTSVINTCSAALTWTGFSDNVGCEGCEQVEPGQSQIVSFSSAAGFNRFELNFEYEGAAHLLSIEADFPESDEVSEGSGGCRSVPLQNLSLITLCVGLFGLVLRRRTRTSARIERV